MFTIEEHVEVTEGTYKGQQGRIHARDEKEGLYYVHLFDAKRIEEFTASQLFSLED